VASIASPGGPQLLCGCHGGHGASAGSKRWQCRTNQAGVL
jgi:hypothetical protein